MVSIAKTRQCVTRVTLADSRQLLTFDQVLRLGQHYRRHDRAPDALAAYMTESDRGKYVFLMDAEGNVTARRAFSDEVGSC